MKAAIVHDWLVTYAGAERVLEQMLRAFPRADLYSLIDFLPPGERGFILNKSVKTSFLQHLPGARTRYRQYLPLMPLAIGALRLRGYDLVISSSHAVAKGVNAGGALHVCMCYTPIRYAWDLRQQYLKESGLDSGIKGMLANALLDYLKAWDLRKSSGVHYFIAISDYIARRISQCYGRESTVIYPPVDIESFAPAGTKEDYYVTASRMVPYKRMDMIVEAFSRMPEKRLVVIGGGPDFRKVQAKAAANVELLGYQPSEVLKTHLQRAKAFVFAAEEDFGILPVEAQACGTPVIAYGKGASTETVIDGVTGILFQEQNVEGVIQAVEAFEKHRAFDQQEIRKNAERFSAARFQEEFRAAIGRMTEAGGRQT
ncbi:MAG: hypothetical protein OHK006_21260 [Thermodesulfovibrionales bacterium]